jgi:predicted Na+-dependent transporter
MTTISRRLAPVLDTLCICVFIAVGKDSHSYDNKGVEWFLTVFWPLAVGWIVGALITRVYTRVDRSWLRLLGTLAIGLFVGGILRGAFTDRSSFSVFTVVAFLFLGLTTFGWRVVWRGVSRVRGTAPAR